MAPNWEFRSQIYIHILSDAAAEVTFILKLHEQLTAQRALSHLLDNVIESVKFIWIGWVIELEDT